MAAKKTTKAKKTSAGKKKAATPKAQPKATKSEELKTETAPAPVKKAAKPKKRKKTENSAVTYSKKLKKLQSGDYESQEKTLLEALLAIEFKVKHEAAGFKKEALVQEVQVGTGETVKRANPAVQEFRAMVKDYASLCKAVKDLCGAKKAEESTSKLADLRSIIKAV